MDHREVGAYWEANAEAWTALSRAGYDLYRDKVNTPAFLAMLPPVEGLRGLDIGCGEGHNTRLVARRGARMAAIDISETFIRHAREPEDRERQGIEFQVASAIDLPFRDTSFDFVTAFMSFMDVPEHDRVVREAFRVLKPGGFLQFSISHPCFTTRQWEWVRDAAGRRSGVICGDYFRPVQGEVEEWIFGAAPEELKRGYGSFRIPRFLRTLSGWMNLLVESGFVIERLEEPSADEKTAREFPRVADTQIIAYFLIVRCRKPAAIT